MTNKYTDIFQTPLYYTHSSIMQLLSVGGQSMILYDTGGVGGRGLERGQIVSHNTWTTPNSLFQK